MAFGKVSHGHHISALARLRFKRCGNEIELLASRLGSPLDRCLPVPRAHLSLAGFHPQMLRILPQMKSALEISIYCD